MVSSLFCRTVILMLQQQQMDQQMVQQQQMSQYLQGPHYPNAPWWTDAAMGYWPPGPPEPPAGAMSKAKAAPPVVPHEPGFVEPVEPFVEPPAGHKEPAPVEPPAGPKEPAPVEPPASLWSLWCHLLALANLLLWSLWCHLLALTTLLLWSHLWMTGGCVGAASVERMHIGEKAHALTQHAK